VSSITANHLLLRLDGSGCSAAEVGGKGAGLDRLAMHGFPIPTSFALSTNAYRIAVAAGHLDEWLTAVAARRTPEPHLLAAEASEIGDRFASLSLPEEMEAEVLATARDLLRTGRVAVRSSATAEDLGTVSFAGQYSTFIGLESPADVIAAVKLCWASLWSPSPREYRRRHRIGENGLAMAVVIQTMVEADWSGVAFTRDPSGRPDAMRIEVVPGTGDSLVSGAVTPLDFTIDRTSLAVVASRSAEPPAFVENLARMLLRVEAELDAPQDVEWSWTTSSGITLLQTRPVTVGGPTAVLDDGFDGPLDGEDTFTPHGVAEMLPGVVPPLLWSINAPMIENGFRTVIADLGGPVASYERRFVARFRGRAALNLSALRDVAEAMPGGSAPAVDEQFLGPGASETVDEPRRRMRLWSRRGRAAKSALVNEVTLVCGAADAVVELGVDLDALPVRQLLAYGHQVRDLAWRVSAAEVAASSAAAAAYQALQSLLARWLEPGEAALWAQQLTAGGLGGEMAGTRLARLLSDLSHDQVQQHPDLVLAITTLPVDRIAASLGQFGDRGQDLLAKVLGASRLAGSMALYGGPTWEESDATWSLLARIAGAPPAAAAAVEYPGVALAAAITRTRRWRTIRVLTGQFVDLRKRWIDRQAREAVAWLRRREQAKTALLTLGGEERRIIAECARRLVASSHLSQADDIELYGDNEVKAMMLGATPVAPPMLNWRRRATQRCRATSPLPQVFTGSPEHAPLPAGRTAGTLSGWAASPGRVSGRAHVVRSLATADGLQPGDILIAEATDPSWTPLLATVSGLVLETGGPLSHGAIVARELGIPAVLCVQGATTSIADGEEVEVDGYSGVVHRVNAEVGVAV
jgi:pyruvate,water dikinase